MAVAVADMKPDAKAALGMDFAAKLGSADGEVLGVRG